MIYVSGGVSWEIPRYLTLSDIYRLLSVSRRTLEKMRYSPEHPDYVPLRDSRGNITAVPLPDFKLGGSPRWEREKFINWLKSLSEPEKEPT
jgi:hypothetical protein